MPDIAPDRVADRRSVLVVGATGGVGQGIVRTALQAGRDVVALGRAADRLERLRVALSDLAPRSRARLVTVVGDLDQPYPQGRRLADGLAAEHGPFAGAVISIGRWDTGSSSVLGTDDRAWESALANNLTSHFRAIRALCPVLTREAALVHISGQSADFPYPGNALVGLTNAARKSLVLSLAEELRGQGPRIYELIIGVTRTEPRRAAGHDDPRWISAEEVGRRTLALIDGDAPDAEQPLHYALAPGPPAGGAYRIDPAASIGHVALRVTDVDRALRFYRDALGFDVVLRLGDQAAFVSAGGYHHHLALLAAARPGLEHVAVRYPRRDALHAALQRLAATETPIDGTADHGETESVYLRDPDGNGVELYIETPAAGA